MLSGMKTHGLVLIIFLPVLLLPTAAQQKKPRLMIGSAAKGGAPANVNVVPDLDQRLAKFPVSYTHLTLPTNREV